MYVTASEQQNSTCWGWQSKYWRLYLPWNLSGLEDKMEMHRRGFKWEIDAE